MSGTGDLEVPGSSPTRQQVALGPDPKLRRVTFVSCGGPGVNRLCLLRPSLVIIKSGQCHSHRLYILTAVTAGQDSDQLLSAF